MAGRNYQTSLIVMREKTEVFFEGWELAGGGIGVRRHRHIDYPMSTALEMFRSPEAQTLKVADRPLHVPWPSATL